MYFAIPNFSMRYGVDPFEFSGRGLFSLIRFVFGNLCGLSMGHLASASSLLLVLISLLIRDADRSRRFGLLTLVIIAPIALIFISDVKDQYWFIQRQFVWVMPFYALLVGQSAAALSSIISRDEIVIRSNQ